VRDDPAVPAIRRVTSGDTQFVQEMLAVAADWRPGAHVRPLDEVLADPALARYVDEWDDDRDAGFVAEQDGDPVGAVWWRFLPEHRRGFGFVDESVPELSIGVVERARGRGVGTLLLDAIVAEARRRSLSGLSLSVEPDNPALVLYRRSGFVSIGRVDGSLTMRLALT
jgi:GNAT superfamily N-acetyltransferase